MVNLYNVLENQRKDNPVAKVTHEFDDNCIEAFDIQCVRGVPNKTHHLQYNRVKIVVDGKSTYHDIQPHREEFAWDDIKTKIAHPDLDNKHDTAHVKK